MVMLSIASWGWRDVMGEEGQGEGEVRRERGLGFKG